MNKSVSVFLLLLIVVSGLLWYLYPEQFKSVLSFDFLKSDGEGGVGYRTVEEDLILRVEENAKVSFLNYSLGWMDSTTRKYVYHELRSGVIKRGENIHLKFDLGEVPEPSNQLFLYTWNVDEAYVNLKVIPSVLYYKTVETYQTVIEPFTFGVVNITHDMNEEGKITFFVNTTGVVRKPFTCVKHSFGVYDVRVDEKTALCSNGWHDLNGSLQEGYYVCGLNSETKFCNSLIQSEDLNKTLEGNKEYSSGLNSIFDVCTFGERSIPSRLKSKVDACYETNDGMQDNQNTWVVSYKKTKGFIEGEEYLGVVLVDRDVFFGEEPGSYEIEDSEGNDIGLKDLEYVVVL